MQTSAKANTALPPAAAQLQQIMKARHSCRAFQPQAVPDAVITQILELAQGTASWCNAQPWQLVITRGAATEAFRQGLQAAVQAGEASPDFPWPREYAGVYQERRRTCGFQLYDAVGIARGDRAASARQMMENFSLFGAPHVAVITTEEALGVYGAVDCGGYVAAFMLAAQAMGVATIAQAAIAPYAPFIRRHFGLPDSRRVVCGISFGYEDATHPANAFRTQRASPAEVAQIVG